MISFFWCLLLFVTVTKRRKHGNLFNEYIGNTSHLGYDLVGFVMGEKGWFDDKSRGLIAKLVTQIALPCYMLYTITQRFTATDLLKMLPELRFPALSMGDFAWHCDSGG